MTTIGLRFKQRLVPQGFLRKKPKNDHRYEWTSHVVGKMHFYQLSEGRVRRVIASPRRTEEGVAPGTVAVMQPGSGKRKEEIWVMYQLIKPKTKDQNLKSVGSAKKRIITAWRYPGVSKPRALVPIPGDILEELENLL